MSAVLDGPHWRFALEVYGRPGVPEACIGLQDRHGLDVNVLLVALWAALARGAAVGAARVAALDARARPIREDVVRPLRQVRRSMKTADLGPHREAVRDRVKAAELAAEQLEQARLAALAGGWPPAPGRAPAAEVAATVLAAYAAAPGPADAAALAQIAAAAESAARPAAPRA